MIVNIVYYWSVDEIAPEITVLPYLLPFGRRYLRSAFARSCKAQEKIGKTQVIKAPKEEAWLGMQPWPREDHRGSMGVRYGAIFMTRAQGEIRHARINSLHVIKGFSARWRRNGGWVGAS